MQGHVCEGRLIASCFRYSLVQPTIYDADHAGVQRAMDQGSFVNPRLTDDRERHGEDTTNDHIKLHITSDLHVVCHNLKYILQIKRSGLVNF